jgi:drug/metabolite transporter (DMT)-like permease
MKTKVAGIVLLSLGILMMIYTGFNYVTSEKVVDLGPIQINSEKNHPVHWSPIIGVVLTIGGILIFVTGKNKT